MHDFYWFTLFVAANSLLLLLLTINVSRLRIKNKISLGDGGNTDLNKAIRVHANGTEQAPVYGLILLSLVYAGASNTVLMLLVISFTLSRVIHAYGMLCKSPISRRMGAAVTYLAQGAAVVSLLIQLMA